MKWIKLVLPTGFALLSLLSFVLVPSLAGAVTHTVNQVNLTFVPSQITIEVGDTVEWIWSAGIHTVTSGTDLNDPAVGALFDVNFTSANPTVTFTFTEAGVQDYFCRPHLIFDMTGSVTVLAPSAVDETPGLMITRLLPNTPNPFNPSTQITFDLAAEGESSIAVSLRVFDLQGRLVRVLLDEIVAAERHSVFWDGRDQRGNMMASGVYLYRLETGGLMLARAMTLVK